MGACSYIVGAPRLQYKEPKTYIKFNEIQSGVKLYLWNGNSTRIQKKAIFDNELRINEIRGREFSTDGDEEYFIVTAIPSENNYQTKFSFTYRLEGTEYPWYEWYYYQMFVVPENGDLFLYGGGAIIVFIVLLVLCCIGMCIRRLCC